MTTTTSDDRSIVDEARERIAEPYRAGSDHPVGSYLGVMGVYGAVTTALGVLAWRRGKVPDRIAAGDLALITAATYRLSRTLAKDPVTSPIRAPFTRFAGTSGPAELKEDVRGTGLQKSVGELVTCPFCLAQWVATGFAFGLLFAPRPTRFVASVMTAVAGADLLQFAHASAQQAAE
ncbi:MAG: DUF1360 domain-containing protein [Actinobacteria bacterium]|nr:DUF1360 domain-containing protein [Actinomycetota bacterium]